MSWATRGSRAARTPASRPCAKGAGFRVLHWEPCDKEMGNAGPALADKLGSTHTAEPAYAGR